MNTAGSYQTHLPILLLFFGLVCSQIWQNDVANLSTFLEQLSTTKMFCHVNIQIAVSINQLFLNCLSASVPCLQNPSSSTNKGIWFYYLITSLCLWPSTPICNYFRGEQSHGGCFLLQCSLLFIYSSCAFIITSHNMGLLKDQALKWAKSYLITHTTESSTYDKGRG